MEKLTRTAKVLDRILAVVYGLTMITACFSLLGCLLNVVLSLMGHNLLGNQGTQLMLGGLTLTLSPEAAPTLPGWITPVISALGVVYLPVQCIMLMILRDTLKPFLNATPFHETVAKNLRTLGILVLVNLCVDALLEGILRYAQSFYDLDALLLSDRVTNIVVGRGFDYSPILFVAALFLLSMVFRYGQELQQLSDETL